MTNIRPGRAAVCAGLSLALALAPFPSTIALAAGTLAENQAELANARARLDELTTQCEDKFAELEEKQAELEDTRHQIGVTEEQIEVKEKELVEARAVLSQNMAQQYKNGTNFLSFLFGSSSFDDLVSRVYYADKVAEHQSDAISTVLSIQEELDVHRADLVKEQKTQEELVEEARTTADELQTLATEQADYVNGLSAEVQAQIEAEREAARKAAEEAARKAAEERARQEEEERKRQEQEQQQQQQQQQDDQTDDQSDDQQNDTKQDDQTDDQTDDQQDDTKQDDQADDQSDDQQDDQTDDQQDDTKQDDQADDQQDDTGDDSQDDSSSTTTTTHTVPNLGQGVGAAIEYAKSQVGVSYSWAGNAIANQEFDCSGLVWWSFNQAGISIPRGQRLSNGASNSMIGWCLSNGGWTTSQANLKAGDLMFWGSSTESTGHVGLCIGGGMMIHSNWNGVEITSVYYDAGSFVGGGPIV